MNSKHKKQKKNIPKHILSKFLKPNDKQVILKAAGEKKDTLHPEEQRLKIEADFPLEMVQTRTQWHDISTVLDGEKLST